MLTPGRHYVDSPVRIAINFQDEDRVDIDPDTVTFKAMSPAGTVTTYVYATDAELVKVNTGDYYVDFNPDASGLWHYRWSSTGTGETIVIEGKFRVQYSQFEEGTEAAYQL